MSATAGSPALDPRDELIEAISSYYPCVFHMAEDGTLGSILEHGLRSTTALLDLYGIEDEERVRYESRRRARMMTLESDLLGQTAIRDNKPFHEGRMKDRLIGMTFTEWYEHLNRRIFFWTTRNRLERFLGAYEARPHLVLLIDTARLLRAHFDEITVSTMNSGATQFTPPKRGQGTFLPLDEERFAARRKSHGRDAIVELTVDYSVPDVGGLLQAVERHAGTKVEEVTW